MTRDECAMCGDEAKLAIVTAISEETLRVCPLCATCVGKIGGIIHAFGPNAFEWALADLEDLRKQAADLSPGLPDADEVLKSVESLLREKE